MNKLIIEAIKTDICYFVRSKSSNYTNYRGTSGLDNYFFDGLKPEATHNPSWRRIPALPKKVTAIQNQNNVNFRYELIDKSFESERTPSIINKEDAGEEGDDGFEWKAKYALVKSLYELRFDTPAPQMVDIEFEIVTVLEIDNIKEYGGFSYPVQKTRWESDGFERVTDKGATHDEIDTIIFPDIILPARKSKLTSLQSYKIVRKHIQDNISPKYAHITSDYEFCFTVKKKIPLAKRIPYQRNVARFGARRAKYVEDFRVNREIEIFEMTHADSNYKGYTPIEGFKGSDIEELKANIDNYLYDLMEMINKPLVDCPACEGRGVLCDKQK